MQRLGIYIHWPYCKSKCPYCDFYSRVEKNVNQADIIAGYLDDLEYYRSLNDGYQVSSIFFGGGTPSLIEPRYVSEIIDKVAALWPCDENVEISLEANPNTDNGRLFSDLRQAGVNRLSLGVQALNDADLRFLGRTHNLEQALQSIDAVCKNFDNHSMDLIYARPKQKSQEWEKELQRACRLGLKHLSLYQLTIEENTVFARKGVETISEDAASELYAISDNVMQDFGYLRYEVSNYAQKGYQCLHNLGYWQGYDYVGIGNGGIGRLHIDGQLYHTYYHRNKELIVPQERAEELLIMGLRLVEGVDKKRFAEQCGINFEDAIDGEKVRQFIEQGMLVENSSHIRATKNGNLVLNYLIENLVK